MKYNIRGKKIEVTDAIRDYMASKIERLEKYLDDNDEVEAKAVVSRWVQGNDGPAKAHKDHLLWTCAGRVRWKHCPDCILSGQDEKQYSR